MMPRHDEDEAVKDAMMENYRMIQPKRDFGIGSPAHHVLRLVANGQITADKGAELIVALMQGRIAKADLPAFEVGGPLIPDLGKTEKFLK